ncbi:uncharacterized protein [Triticum aestivum]|uniref:uncharacterized protein n=1 Tax=Triticum aestivum TaxID=4565 RepID=UPI001D02302A|nr:uncharacterized protein LOC123106132 [Triticum aestivum]
MTRCLRSVAGKASRGFRKRVVVNDPVAAVAQPPHPSLSGGLSNPGYMTSEVISLVDEKENIVKLLIVKVVVSTTCLLSFNIG